MGDLQMRCHYYNIFAFSDIIPVNRPSFFMTNHFEVLKTDARTSARRGRLQTLHGPVDTPVFMPVGTQATV